MEMDLGSDSTTDRSCPGFAGRNMASERRRTGHAGTAAPAPNCPVRTCGLLHTSQSRAGERVPFELAWSATHQEEPEPTDPTRSLHETEEVVDGLVRPLHLPGRVA